MKRILIASLALVFLALTSSTFAQAVGEKKDTQASNSNSAKPKPAMSKKALERKLISVEKSLWEAFKNKDASPFEKNLSSDSFQLDGSGLTMKADVLKSIGGCDVKDYSLTDFKVTSVTGGGSLVTYKATVHGSCGGQAIPEVVYASSLWVSRGGKWQALFHQESAAAK
jgi:hypothetical protein